MAWLKGRGTIPPQTGARERGRAGRRHAGRAAAVLLLALLTKNPAHAQEIGIADAIVFATQALLTHQALEKGGAPGLVTDPQLRARWFDADLGPALDALADRIHPLTGGPQPGIDAYAVGMPEPTPEGADITVSVTSEGTLRDIVLVLERGEDGKVRIADVRDPQGEWSLARMARFLGSSAETPSAAPTPAADPSDGLAARDETATENASGAAEAPAQSDTGPAVQVLNLGFEEDFEALSLDEGAWSMRNPEPDRFLADSGEILLLAAGGGIGIADPQPTNLLTLERALPDGDVTLALDFRLEPKTVAESVWLGVREGENDFIAASLSTSSYWFSACDRQLFVRLVNARGDRPAGEDVTTISEIDLFDGPILSRACRENRPLADALYRALAETGARLVLQRTAGMFSAAVEIVMPEGVEGAGQRVRIETGRALRPDVAGFPVVLLGQSGSVAGESVAYLEHFSVGGPQ